MSKEMNNLKVIITKYDITLALFMSLIIGIIFSYIIAIAFLTGIVISLLNFRFTIYTTEKLVNGESFKHVTGTILRIISVIIFSLFFIHNFVTVMIYLLGYSIHFFVLGYCILKRKGSA